MPALGVALALFMVAELIIITSLGVSFKGVRQFSASGSPSGQSFKGEPTRRVSSQNSQTQISSAPRAEMKTSIQTSKLQRQRFPLLTNPTSWPPVESRLYPDMELYNQDGDLTRLSDLSGNVIVVQPVAMNCPLSQAYSGANNNGKDAYRLCLPNNGVIDFAKRMHDCTGISTKTPGFVFVQILFYNLQNEPPSLEDGRLWAEHFDLRTSNNQYVLVATPEMVTRKSAMLIPGFQLIDRTFTLRSDSTGILPKRSLYNHFFPTLRNLFQLPQVSENQDGASQVSQL